MSFCYVIFYAILLFQTEFWTKLVVFSRWTDSIQIVTYSQIWYLQSQGSGQSYIQNRSSSVILIQLKPPGFTTHPSYVVVYNVCIMQYESYCMMHTLYTTTYFGWALNPGGFNWIKITPMDICFGYNFVQTLDFEDIIFDCNYCPTSYNFKNTTNFVKHWVWHNKMT